MHAVLFVCASSVENAAFSTSAGPDTGLDMRQRQTISRCKRSLSVAAALTSSACSGASPTDTPPSVPARYYRVDPSRWLPQSFAVESGFHAGDLVLRSDHTYRRAFAPFGPFATQGATDDGRWQQSGSVLTLQAADSTKVDSAVIAGDSIHMNFSRPPDYAEGRFFRADLTGASLPPGAWVLRSINGRVAADTSGIIAGDAPSNGGRLVTRVRYDTLVFSDGVFARNTWAGTATLTPASGPPQVTLQQYTTDGLYNAAPDLVTIQYLATLNKTSARYTAYRDTLSVRGDTLIRSLALTTGTFEQRYVRLR